MADPTPDQDDTPKESEPPLTGEQAASAEPADTAESSESSESSGTADVEPPAPARRRMSPVGLAGIIGLVLIVALGGLVGWQGWRTYQAQQDADLRAQFLDAGREGAFALTNVNWEQAEADVERILNSATGTFYDDMDRRAPSYTELVKQAQSTSVGTVTEIGLESSTETDARVLAAVTINSSNIGVPEQQPQAWRMRLTVQKVGDEAKVSMVEFVQ